MTIKIGLDVGRSNVKVFDGRKYLTFPSIVGEARELKLDYHQDDQGFRVTFHDHAEPEHCFIGTLARDESEFARQMLLREKATPDTYRLAMTALSQYIPEEQTEGYFDVITGVPVRDHDPVTKQRLIDLLQRSCTLTVDGVLKRVHVTRVRVTVEGGGAFWASPKDGTYRLIDAGSRTINYITMRDRRYVDKESGTLDFGFDTNKSTNLRELTAAIVGEVGKRWDSHDQIGVIGGNAVALTAELKRYFPNAHLFDAGKRVSATGQIIDPNLFANAIGYYTMGRSV